MGGGAQAPPAPPGSLPVRNVIYVTMEYIFLVDVTTFVEVDVTNRSICVGNNTWCNTDGGSGSSLSDSGGESWTGPCRWDRRWSCN